jgi:protein ImuB
VEAGWWGEMQTGDYFMAQGEDHAHYWLFKERGEKEPRWYCKDCLLSRSA